MYGWMSDIHMNFLTNNGVKRKFLKSVHDISCPIFVTGDISDGPNLEKNLIELSKASEYPFYFVTGNHDYYHSGFSTIRMILERLTKEYENLIYLPVCGIIPLSEDTCIIGTDSWYDGRISSDLLRLPFEMNDFNYIRELIEAETKKDKISIFQNRADDALKQLRDLCGIAVKKYRRIIILSHPVPLARLEAHPYSELSPFYIWYDAGKYILDFSECYPEIEFLWLAGHTHMSSKFCVGNFSSYVLGAEYGYPRIGAVIDDDFKVKTEGMCLK